MRTTIIGHRARHFSGQALILLILALTNSLLSQTLETGALTGKITDSSGNAVPNATVTATSAETGQFQSVSTGAEGSYRLERLPSGNYLLKVEATGFKPLEIRPATVDRGRITVVDGTLEAIEPTNGQPATVPQELPNAPSSATTAPTLSDLGLTPAQTQGNPREQALLDKRTHMLKIHQRMGLITTVPLIATVATSLNAGGKQTSTSSRYLHTALGGLTGDLYFITAYYAIRAPRVPGTQTRGPIRFHKAMAWIHGPGMIMTPILGIVAFDQKSNGEKVHGIASAHGPVAIVTAGAFGAALLSVSVKF
jgi:hypothetical protein